MTQDAVSGPSAKARAVVDRGIPVDTWEWVDVVNAIGDLIAENERLTAALTDVAGIGNCEDLSKTAEEIAEEALSVR